jgi:hypothetical protein
MRAAFGSGVIATRSVLDFDADVWAVPAALLALVINASP